MKLRTLLLTLILLLLPLSSMAGEPDYLARMAYHSEIKAEAKITQIVNMGANSDGTIREVHFKNLYAITPYTPKNFVGACKTLDSSWQRRNKNIVYYKPRPGQRVFVTISTDHGAITSFTPLNKDLDHVVRNEPERLGYRHGKAFIIPAN